MSSSRFVTSGPYRWDPAKSTRIKWETTYASELQSRGLTQDFTGLSELLLGQAQPAQFQTADQTGYRWNSKVSDDGSFTELDTGTSNQNTHIPRSYVVPFPSGGVIYNFFAATAENKSDSVCPSGWRMPTTYDNDPSKSYYRLLNDMQVDEITANPISLQRAGYYDDDLGRVQTVGDYGYYFVAGQSNIKYIIVLRKLNFTLDVYSPSAWGANLRCVKR